MSKGQTNSIFPHEREVNGNVVLNGTASLHPHHHIIIQDPITVKVENGLITDIRGGNEAVIFEKWLESYNDENAYLSSHMGFGLDRITQRMLNLDNVREAILLPRDPERITP